MWNIQANIYLDEEAKQKDPIIGNLLEKVMNKYVYVLQCMQAYLLYGFCNVAKCVNIMYVYMHMYVHTHEHTYYIHPYLHTYIHMYVLML